MATSHADTVVFSATTGIRDWPVRIESILTAAGWVHTADTGQTAAISLPAATGTYQSCGYQIWRMDDTLQATAPCFMKIEFGSTQTVDYPGIWVTIGTGSDGSGAITGQIISRTTSSNGVSNMPSVDMVCSGSTNRLCFWVGLYTHIFFSIERTKDATGADTGDGVLVILDSGSTTSVLQIFRLARWSGVNPPNSTTWGAFVPSGATWSLGSDVGVSPVRFFEGQPSNPCINALVYLSGDIPEHSTPSVSMYGTSHTYFTIGTTRLNTVVPNGASTLMMLYE